MKDFIYVVHLKQSCHLLLSLEPLAGARTA